MDTKTIPIFPLDLVLFPGQTLPLRIFEPRYKQLVDDCMLGDGQFGVCLIDEHNKISNWQAPHGIGTIAKITKCQDIDITGKQLSVEAIGRGKFKIIKIIEPVMLMPDDYDPFSDEGLGKIADTHEKIGTSQKQYIRAEIQMVPQISDALKLETWKELVQLWKQKIISQATQSINADDLNRLLEQYYLVTDLPTVDYVYSLAALGASTPNDLQPLLEVDNLDDLLKRVRELFVRR